MNLLNKVRLLTPGPTEIPDRIRQAMAKPMIHHRKDEFVGVLTRNQIYLKKLFQTKEEVLPLACTGTGAMTAAVTSLFAPKEKVLVVNIGKFGERWIEIAKTLNLEVVEYRISWGNTLSASELDGLLEENPSIKGVLLQICETSTGAQNPIKEIADVTRKRDVLLIADGVSAVGISPCYMDEWGIDCLVTGSQKGLMLPAGLSLIALSRRAWNKAERLPNTCYYFNLVKERDNCLENQTSFSSPVSLLMGLHEALEVLFAGEVNLNNVYSKQWALTQMVRHGITALGLRLSAPKNYAWGVTGVLMPAGKDSAPIVQMMEDDYNIIVTQGQAPMKAEMLRIGHMGWVDYADVAAALYALAQSLERVYAFEIPAGYLEDSLDIYFKEYKKSRS